MCLTIKRVGPATTPESAIDWHMGFMLDSAHRRQRERTRYRRPPLFAILGFTRFEFDGFKFNGFKFNLYPGFRRAVPINRVLPSHHSPSVIQLKLSS